MFDYEDENFGDLTGAVAAITAGEEMSEPALIEAGTLQLAIELARCLPQEIGSTTALTVLEAALTVLRSAVGYGTSNGVDEPAELLAIRASTLANVHEFCVQARTQCELETLATGYLAPGGDA